LRYWVLQTLIKNKNNNKDLKFISYMKKLYI
jgi:hypothetical protein